MNRHRLIPTLLLTAALLLITLGIASADLKPTNVLRSWDDAANQYENGNLTL